MKSYNSIKMSHTDLESMYHDIYVFDLRNPEFFESKLDLARYYLLVGNYDEAFIFLTRAESIAKKFPKQVSKENEAAMYGCFATLCLMNKKLESAYDYVEKAYKIPKYGKIYGYLAGRILSNLERRSEALEYFNKTYEEYPNLITDDEIRPYMYLLGESKDYKKALELLEVYFEKGKFFPGLGMFASGVYEKNNLFGKSIFSAFLDYEYQSCFGNTDDERFVINLKTLRNKIVNETNDEESLKSIDYIISLYVDLNVPDIDNDFFPANYIRLKKIAKNGMWKNVEFNEYLSLEKYFKNFPCYYWNLWKMVCKVDSANLGNWKVVLEKILMLGNSDYYESARISLGRLSGLSDKDASKILLPQEVQRLILVYLNNGDTKALDYIFNLLELPDCDYLVQSYPVIKQNLNNKTLKQAFYDRGKMADGRLKERITYILN